MLMGINAGLGAPIGEPFISELQQHGFQIQRTAAQRGSEPNVPRSSKETVHALVDETITHGMIPYVNIRWADQIHDLPFVPLHIELGNEPDLAKFGWTVQIYTVAIRDAVRLVEGTPFRLWIGVISNLNNRGFSFLQQLPWSEIPFNVGAAYHRYPRGHGAPPTAGHDGRTREQELAQFRSIVGARPIGISEVGYNELEYPEAQAAEFFAWERNFLEQTGHTFAISYQMIDGPQDSPDVENHYGWRDLETGRWKKQTAVWTQVEEPPVADNVSIPRGELESIVDTLRATTDRLASYLGAAPPDPEPEPGPFHEIDIFVKDPAAAPIAGAEVKYTESGITTAAFSDSEGLVPLLVLGSNVYTVSKDGWTTKTVDLPPGQHNVHLEKAVVPIPDPTPGDAVTPLVGYIRPQPNRTIGDDSGPRSVRGVHCMCLVRWMHDKPDFALRQLDKMMGRYQIVRFMWHLMHPDAWVPMNASVSPKDSWFDAAFDKTLRACWERGLYVNLTSGDHAVESPRGTWTVVLKDDELPGLYRHVAGLCKDVNEQVIGINEGINEGRVNSLHRDNYDWWASLLKEFKSVYPWGVSGTTDPDGDPEAKLPQTYRAPADAVLIHGTRVDPAMSIRRAFNLRHEGLQQHAVIEGEPNGIDTGPRPGVTDGTTDRDHIFGLYAAKILTGQVLFHFDSAGLGWHHYEIDREWGFRELPDRWKAMNIPDDIGLWRLAPGHHINAPISAQTLGTAGSSPDRLDNIVSPDGRHGYGIIQYGHNRWDVFHREGVPMKLWRAEGDPQDVGSAFNIPAEKVAILEWHK